MSLETFYGKTSPFKQKVTEQEILEVAAKLKITFYDKSYAYCVNIKNLTFITENTQLLRKLMPYVKASNLSAIIQPTK